jgi:hypothetical protein
MVAFELFRVYLSIVRPAPESVVCVWPEWIAQCRAFHMDETCCFGPRWGGRGARGVSVRPPDENEKESGKDNGL